MRMSLRFTPSAQRKNRLVIKISGSTYRRSVSAADFSVILPFQLNDRPWVMKLQFSNMASSCVAKLSRCLRAAKSGPKELSCFSQLIFPKSPVSISPLFSSQNTGPLTLTRCLSNVCPSLFQSPIQVHVTAVHIQVLPGNMAGTRGKQKHHHVCNFFRLCHSLAERNARHNRLQLFLGIRKRAHPLLIKRRHDLRRHYRIHANPEAQQFRSPFARQRKNRSLSGSVA